MKRFYVMQIYYFTNENPGVYELQRSTLSAKGDIFKKSIGFKPQCEIAHICYDMQ